MSRLISSSLKRSSRLRGARSLADNCAGFLVRSMVIMLTQRRKLNRSTSPIRRYLSKRCGAFDAPVHSPPGLWDAGRTDGLAFVVCSGWRSVGAPRAPRSVGAPPAFASRRRRCKIHSV